MADDALPLLNRLHRQSNLRICLNQHPAVRIVVRPMLPAALVTLELDDFADVLEGHVERRLM